MSDFKPFTVERPWGTFRQLTHNSLSTVKIHRVKPFERTSLQSHAKRSELWHIISGSGKVVLGDKELDANPSDEFTAKVGVKHRFIGGPEGMIIAEVATGDFDESDITRYEDKYGRA